MAPPACPYPVPLVLCCRCSMEGMRRFKYGAAALAKYALTNRAEVRRPACDCVTSSVAILGNQQPGPPRLHGG